MDETRSPSRRSPGPVLVNDGTPDDLRDRLVARVAELERSHLAEDVEGFASLFLPHAVWVTVAARRLTGRDAIEEFAAGVLPGAFVEGAVRYEVELVRLVTLGVALTCVHQTYYDDVGAETGHALTTYVWRHDGRDWYVAACHSTAAHA